VETLTRDWRKRGYELDFGVGIAQGYATLGAIGFEGPLGLRRHRHRHQPRRALCGEARPGQILIRGASSAPSRTWCAPSRSASSR
jgi:hypothetical protein